MNLTPITPDLTEFPPRFHRLLSAGTVYDSSCSPEARVYYVGKEGGLFLKTASEGSLRAEAELTRYLHSKGLSAEVLAYESHRGDWLLTRRIPGEDCLSLQYTQEPVRLCDTTAQLLRMLHDTDTQGCPIPDRTGSYIATALNNYHTGCYDRSHFPDNWGYASAEEAMAVIARDAGYLKSDILLHGDYCLPNIILDNWRFSGFIDLGSGGVGDRHIDLFWGIWSLWFNLKTDRYRERFLDAYGRDLVNEDIFPVIGAIEVFG